MSENVFVLPTLQIKLRPRRQKPETGLRKFRSALSRQHGIEHVAARQPGRRHDKIIFLKMRRPDRALGRERMPGAADEDVGILEQAFLGEIVLRRRRTKRAENDVDTAGATSADAIDRRQSGASRRKRAGAAPR